MAIAASEPPKESDPVSPMEIFAGGALYHRNPKQAPTIDPQKIESSFNLEYILFEDIQKKFCCHPMYEINMNDRATSMTGTVALNHQVHLLS